MSGDQMDAAAEEPADDTGDGVVAGASLGCEPWSVGLIDGAWAGWTAEELSDTGLDVVCPEDCTDPCCAAPWQHSGPDEPLDRWRRRVAAMLRSGSVTELLDLLIHRPNLNGPELNGLPGVSAQALLDSVILRKRLTAMISAGQIEDLGELARHYPGLDEQLDNEIGCALTIGDAAAGRLIDLGRTLTSRLPQTMKLLRVGAISLEHASAMVAAIENTTDEVAAWVDEAMSEVIVDLPPAEVKDRARRRVLNKDGDAARKRHEKAVGERTVERWGLGDGMAQLRVTAAAEEIAQIWHAITVLAAEVRTPGDSRSLGNVRTDVLVDVCRHALRCDSVAGTGKAAAATDRPWALVNITVPYTVLAGGDESGYVHGIGPVTADQARGIILANLCRRVVTDPLSGSVLDVGRSRYRPSAAIADHVRVRDVTCTEYGCRRPAVECQVDHRTPFRPGRTAGGVTSVDACDPKCLHHHRAKDGGGCRSERTGRGYVWTTPMGRSYLKPPPALYESDPDDPDDHWARQLSKPKPPLPKSPLPKSPLPKSPPPPSVSPDHDLPPF